MPQWQGSTRKQRLPGNWETLRKRVLRRDGYQCTAQLRDAGRCPETATDVDHIKPNDDDSESNLTSLCGWHHQQKSSREGAAAAARHRAKIRKKRYLPKEAHPGLL